MREDLKPEVLWTFLPVAIVVAITPGPAFALAVRSAVRSGPRAVFFVALVPQFVPDGAAVLPATLAMAGLLVARLRDAVRERLARRLERLAGGVLVALGVPLGLERAR